jgi:hypothetical protein
VLIGWIVYAAYHKLPNLKTFLDWLMKSVKDLLFSGGKGDTALGGADGAARSFGDLDTLTTNTRQPAQITIGGSASGGGIAWEQ